ncbi:hypothetical protein ARMSODRAFT_1022185 [Armillaria solidipes]|uniref:Retrovirus-related Pol polyprotein from transposon TNT 1-94-like beta-barrel domain-containing protein n=1 Tax=Armillaria solidipes TaxID=1076256 RepID=A0A2H3B4F5_9AGAR|nr:hypothetical protein ARMSODRAFT_1022185 [Armillaria solidipes]
MDMRNSDPKAYFAAIQVFKALLDSDTTHHIVNDHMLFHTYNVAGAVPITTANCGILTTKAMGEAQFTVDDDGQTSTIILRDCLHASEAPINLISVGALTEHGMYIGFRKNKTTCYFPKNHKTLQGLSFKTNIVRHLSFLECNLILPEPQDDTKATAFTMLPPFKKPEYDADTPSTRSHLDFAIL